MSNITYNLVQTGSKGNCLILNNFLALDMGITFKKLKPYYKNLKLVFIGHEHSDHLKKQTIKTLAKERPTLRFCVGKWLVPILLECGVSKQNIDIIEAQKIYDYGICKISPIVLYHDVETFGLRIYIGDEKALYITDTRTVEGIQAKDYQWYFIESNYGEDELQERIDTKMQTGQYCYELNVAKRHLSHEQASEFLIANMSKHSDYVFLHGHIDKTERAGEWDYSDEETEVNSNDNY